MFSLEDRVIPPQECQFGTQVFGGVYCANFNCQKPAKYTIGRLVGPPSLRMPLCEDCARELVFNAPAELQMTKEEAALLCSNPAPSTIKGDSPDNPTIGEGVAKAIFTCSKCGETFPTYAERKGHQKTCRGEGK